MKLGKDVCSRHDRWIRFQDAYRQCPECAPDRNLSLLIAAKNILGDGHYTGRGSVSVSIQSLQALQTAVKETEER